MLTNKKQKNNPVKNGQEIVYRGRNPNRSKKEKEKKRRRRNLMSLMIKEMLIETTRLFYCQ